MTQPPTPPYGTPGEQPYGQQPAPPPYVPPAPAPGPAPGFGGPVAGPFFLAVMGQEQGPLDYGQLAQMAVAGQVKGDTPLRAADQQLWMPARQVPGLFSDKEWLTAVLLAWFLGAFGVDRFYLGYTGLGVAKLVVCILTCGIGGVIWQIIDLVLIAMRKVPDAQGRPLP